MSDQGGVSNGVRRGSLRTFAVKDFFTRRIDNWLTNP